MKRLISLCIILILLVGCENKKSVDITYDNSYFKIAMPYKEEVGGYSLRSYDKKEVESMLMNLSSNYFKPNNSLYQQGQYLDKEQQKELINLYNNTDSINIDGKVINPKYITAIYEQDYLTTNNNLKGISLAIVVNNKQYYNESNYKIINENIVLEYAKTKAQDLANYIYSKEELKDIRLVIGIYLESNNTLKGSFKYIGEANNSSIDLKYINYNYQSLDSNYIMNNDVDTYNNILAIKQSLSNYNNLYLNPIGLYKNSELVKVDLFFNKSYYTNAEILAYSDIITNNFNSFASNVQINVYFKSSNNIIAYIVKKDNSVKTYIMEE